MTKKILIIDDNEDILFAMSAICDYEDWISYTAVNVIEGIKILKAEKPDVVLIDYHMPMINGIEGVKKIRKIDDSIPIIVLTIEEDQDVADEFMSAGASDFALKPIKAPDIISRINVHLRLKKSIETVKKVTTDYSKGISDDTLDKITRYMGKEDKYLPINTIAKNTGLAYQTVHRYLQYMISEDQVELLYEYGDIGRPQHKYKLN